MFDLVGMWLDSKLPALREHDHNRPVGVFDRNWRREGRLGAEGYFATNHDGKQLSALLGDLAFIPSGSGCRTIQRRVQWLSGRF